MSDRMPLPNGLSISVNQSDAQIKSEELPASDDLSLIVLEHRPWIERLITARTGKSELVDDLLQELNLAVIQSQVRPIQPNEVASWICRIVIRLCARVIRDQVRLHRKLVGFCESRQPDETTFRDPIFWILHEEQREIVREELAKMEPETRRLLSWKYVQGMSYSEIGTRLCSTRHVAEYRVIAARRELRSRLEARGIGDDQTL